MYTETDGSRKAIGDVDVVFHDGLYHLFHLVLPNHDFIAHAVSTDGLSWRRVSNALFIGDPGSWDDLMLWTMHVSPDPAVLGQWRMFYTGLSRSDEGKVQRIGLAISSDLYHWRKAPVNWEDRRGAADPAIVKLAATQSISGITDHRNAAIDLTSCFPIVPDRTYYEADLDVARHWVSFRDPFYYKDEEKGWLLVAGRVNHGPAVRRGCVALYQEVTPGQFAARPPLHHPQLYDDIEVPNLLQIESDYYLIGSCREDAKVRYWHTNSIDRPWRSYHDNVLLAQGNYAARITKDDKGWLLWNFYSLNMVDRTAENLMPPPKRLARTYDGLLVAKSFENFLTLVDRPVDPRRVRTLKDSLGEDHVDFQDGELDMTSESGFQAFVFEEPMANLIFQAKLTLKGSGKCGLVFRIDPESHDGYYLSLDLLKGVAQLRSWGTGEVGSGEHMMQFRTLQSGFWFTRTPGEASIQLIALGSYVEFCIDDRVILTLADKRFQSGLVGIYLESAHMKATNLHLNHMKRLRQTDEHLVSG